MRRKQQAGDDDVIADGTVLRVGMMFRDEDGLPGRVFRDDDGIKTEAADWQISYVRDCRVAHGLGLEDGEALHRPGARFCTDAAANEAVAKAYLQAKQALQDAWRHPTRDAERDDPVTGYGSHGFKGAKVGDPCTCRGPEFPLDVGSPGHLEERDGRLVCVPDRERGREDSRSKMDARDEAYVAMCRELENAWRGK
jgi:hypothetical protein